jgi:hypothetical protein
MSKSDDWYSICTEVNLTTDELSKITELINNPPKPSERLQKAIDNWKSRCIYVTKKENKS